jgi:hypothetical protein
MGVTIYKGRRKTKQPADEKKPKPVEKPKPKEEKPAV